MDTKQILKNILTNIINRKEIFNASINRGEGKGMQIEKWILIEMLANLIKLKDNGVINSVEGEHKYPKPKYANEYEHCDLWWKSDGQENWLEVKTIVLAKDAQKGSLEDVSKDLKKMDRLREDDIFHHLSVIFPVECEKVDKWKKEISEIYYENKLKSEQEWECDMGDNNLIIFLLFTK